MRTLVLLLAACNPPLPEGEPEPEPEGTIGPEGGVLASEDGVLTLTIPEGALAAETEMSIAALAEADWPADVAALEPIGGVVYDVQPEGTVFSVPVTFQWAFATAPAAMSDDQGRPLLVAGTSAAADGGLETHATTERNAAGTAVTSTAEHLSLHFLSYVDHGTRAPYGPVAVDLNGGRHAVLEVWGAREISWIPGYDDATLGVSVEAFPNGVVAPVPNDDYVSTSAGATAYDGGHPDLPANEPFSPPLPEFRCTEAGSGAAKISFTATLKNASTVSTTAEEPVECEEQKAEYTAQEDELGDRIFLVGVPDTTSVNLDDNAGAHGFLVDVPAGGTVRVCVDTTGSATVTYYPRFHPGFEFADPSTGCTDVTNKDAEKMNQVLVVVEGTGTATVTTSVP